MSLKRRRSNPEDLQLAQLTQSSMPGYSQYSQYSQSRRRRVRARLRAKYPRYRSVRTVTPYNAPFTIERNVQWDAPLNLSSGWYTTGPGLAFAFSLSYLEIVYSNSSGNQIPIPGSTELSSLFDQWRLDRVDLQILYSATNHNATPSGTNTIVMPVIHIVNDYDDGNVTSSWNPLEYPECRTIQLGQNPRGVRHTLWKPTVLTSMETPSGASLGGQRRSAWIDCGTPEIINYGIKVKYSSYETGASPDYSPDGISGAAKFQFKLYYTLRNPR